jgi:hypothetical protein
MAEKPFLLIGNQDDNLFFFQDANKRNIYNAICFSAIILRKFMRP